MEAAKKQTTPKGHEIPIPTRGEVLKVFKKAATHQEKSEKKSRPRSPKK